MTREEMVVPQRRAATMGEQTRTCAVLEINHDGQTFISYSGNWYDLQTLACNLMRNIQARLGAAEGLIPPIAEKPLPPELMVPAPQLVPCPQVIPLWASPPEKGPAQ